jgi:ABC-type sugar transport system permease subunit
MNSTAAMITFSILWMISSVALQAALGIAVALVLERPGVRFANAWRVVYPAGRSGGRRGDRVARHRPSAAGLFSQLVGGPVEGSRAEISPRAALAGTWMGWPLWMLVATAGLRTIPRSVHEAAAIEGAGRWSSFARITLPLLLPLLGAAFVVRGVAAFNQFYLFYIMFMPDQTTTLATLSFNLFNSGFGPGLYSIAAAINIGTLVALLAVVVWFFRWRSRAERVALR